DLDRVWNDRARQLNDRLQATGLPVRVANLSSIWTVCYTVPSRYNWMLQYYLRAEGLALSWVGTGRLVFSLNFTDADFAAVEDRFVAACEAMRDEGWWWTDGTITNRAIRRQILREMWTHRSFLNARRATGEAIDLELPDADPPVMVAPTASREKVNEELY
ncbi:MAG TPA: hypothetical protein VHX39_17505, partial [Acetobacteraceae bacterium]|nr:hypothetical protein [Acetobacteraceae bacterium]